VRCGLTAAGRCSRGAAAPRCPSTGRGPRTDSALETTPVSKGYQRGCVWDVRINPTWDESYDTGMYRRQKNVRDVYSMSFKGKHRKNEQTLFPFLTLKGNRPSCSPGR